MFSVSVSQGKQNTFSYTTKEKARKRERERRVSVEINFPQCEKRTTANWSRCYCLFQNVKPSLGRPSRRLIRRLRTTGAPEKRRILRRGVAREKGVRKLVLSLCSYRGCCTLWCLRGPFVSDYGFLSPAPSRTSVEGRRKEGKRSCAHIPLRETRRDCDAGL